MTEYFADILTSNMLADGLIRENEKSIYLYSIQILVEKVIGFSVIFLLAAFQGCLLETILFIICFSNLRKYTGGFHAKTFGGCFIGTVSIYMAYVKLIYPYFLKNLRVKSSTKKNICQNGIMIPWKVNHLQKYFYVLSRFLVFMTGTIGLKAPN